ncbi:MAG: carbonic anhydrase [Pseudomonadota bacterium]
MTTLIAGTLSPFANAAVPDNAIGGDAALKRLMQGNERYVSNKPVQRDFSAGRVARTKTQKPIVAILSCADSRVAPELAFDQSLGDVFVVRVAGNIVNDDGLASLEYAVSFLGVPLVMVLGHSNCGAVDAAIKVLKENIVLPGHLPGLIDAIKPAVEKARQSSPEALLPAAIKQNVIHNVERITGSAPVLAGLTQNKTIKVVGGIYDLATGRVSLV